MCMCVRTRDAREQHLRVSEGGGEKERENGGEVRYISCGMQSHRCTGIHTHACRHGGGSEARGGGAGLGDVELGVAAKIH